jgi:molybdate transport system substrate-binding protein
VTRKAIVCTASALGLLVAIYGGAAVAAEIAVLSTTALNGVMPTLIPDFERSSGNKVTIAFQTSGAAKKRIEDGDAVPDIAILTGPGIDDLIRQGKIVAGSKQNLARLGMGVAVRAGAPKPDIATSDAFRRALLAASSIAYPDPAGGGASGATFVKLLDRLGVADAVKGKTKLATGPAGELVASGEAELAVQQLAELKAVPGIEIVGPFPPELQTITVLTAGILTGARQPAAAEALMNFLAAPEAVSAVMAAGMDPG